MKIAQMALMVWMAGAAYGREPQKLPVYVRLGTTDRLSIVPLAQIYAARMFAEIGIQLEWKAEKRPAECSQPPISIEVAAETGREIRPGVLAFAFYNDTRITVFLDRVEKFECPAIVLAHVLVHEITHILQGTDRHSEAGVMKARWISHDYSEMRHQPLPFTAEDLELIYQGLSKRVGCKGVRDIARLTDPAPVRRAGSADRSELEAGK